MSPKKRTESPNGAYVEVNHSDMERMSQLLDEHIAEFDQWREDWSKHREEAKLAMKRIGDFEPALQAIAENITHLKCLPDIKESIHELRVGLSAQNATLLTQQDKFISPAQKAQTLLYNLLIMMVVMAGITLAVVLLRETDHGFKAGPFEMTPRGAQSQAAPNVTK